MMGFWGFGAGRKADFYTADVGAGARELKGDDDGN